MSAQSKTRQEVAANIRDRISNLELEMEGIPADKWHELIGEMATQELNKIWVKAILDGMQNGTITVGDPRLADMLDVIENSVMCAAGAEGHKTAKARFTQLKMTDSEADPDYFWEAVRSIERMTTKAIEAGLTTPGQDLYAAYRPPFIPGPQREPDVQP